MITYVKGDIFTSPAKLIVNTVNTVGVMGKGVALEYKNRYPEMFRMYKELCDTKRLDVGKLALWKGESKWVLLFPTKKHWRNSSKLEYVESGLRKFADNWDSIGVNSVAFPRLGCGNGGLNWDEVRPLMEKYLNPLPIQVFVYVDKYDDPKPEHEDVTEIEKWLSGEAETIGYEKFRIKLRNFIAHNGNDTITEKNGMIFINENCIAEADICNFWNWIKDAGIFTVSDIPEIYKEVSKVLIKVMYELNYLSRIFISGDGVNFPEQANGFQYIEEANV